MSAKNNKRKKNIREFLQEDLWRTMDVDIASRSKKIGYNTLKTIILSCRGFANKDLNIRAHSMCYMLLFAIVPILSLVLAVANGFGFANVIEDELNKSFLGEMNLVPTIMGCVDRYLETAQGGVFLGVGMLILIWAVYAFFRNVEVSFNKIWNVKKSRSLLRQIVNYICILFLIPILIVVTSGLSIFLNSSFASIPELQAFQQVHATVVKVFSFGVTWLLLTWLYMAIPNTKVHFISAFIPAVIMGSLFHAIQALSVYVIMFLSRMSVVYGAFAGIPILMVWLQFSCLMILIGAEMSYCIQNSDDYAYAVELNKMSRRYKDYIMLYLLHQIVIRFNNDEQPLTANELALSNHLPTRLVARLLSRMEETQLVREAYIENKEERTFLPAFDTHRMTVGMVIERIDKQGMEEFLMNVSPEMDSFWQRYLNFKKRQNDSLQSVLVMDL